MDKNLHRKVKLNIRVAQATDWASIQKIVLAAFSEEENKAIVKLVAGLFSEASRPPIRHLVAEIDNQAIGYVAYSPIYPEAGASLTGYILSPLAVSPEHQHGGVGSSLVKSGIEILSKATVDVLLVYGDPKYYERFGFEKESARSFVPPYPLEYPFGWLGMMLNGVDAPKSHIKFECVQSLNKSELW